MHAWHACKRVSEFWSFGFLLQITISALHHAHLLIFNATNPCHLSYISGRTFLPQFGSFQRKERDDCDAGEREQLQIRNPAGEPMHSIRKTFLVQSRAGSRHCFFCPKKNHLLQHEPPSLLPCMPAHHGQSHPFLTARISAICIAELPRQTLLHQGAAAPGRASNVPDSGNLQPTYPPHLQQR